MTSIIKVNEIQDAGGNTILSSNGTGTFTSNLPDNTPAFFMNTNGSVSITNSVFAKIPYDTTIIDTDGGADTVNNRFTIPAGKGGKYLISYAVGAQSDSASTFYRVFTGLYKNGSDTNLLSAVADPRNSYGFAFSVSASGVMEFNAGDYIEVYAYISTGNTAGIVKQRTFLSGYKLIGA